MVKINKEAHIPLLPYDLGYEETILQLIKSLDCLDKVVECVFEHVRGNINSQKSEILKLSDKLNTITHKVNLLSNTKKTVQVFSSSKYPASHCSKDYEYSYDFDIKSDITENIKVTHQISVSHDQEDKIKVFRVDNDNHKLSKNKNIIPIKGLGCLPEDMKYVNSLLLFNSNENLYKNYVLSNPYKVNKMATNKEVENVENSNQPVFSLPSNDTENQFDYFYTPEYEEVPSIDVPPDLPDLPGIAGNEQYAREEVNMDVPVVYPTSNVVDLPNLDELDDFNNFETIEVECTATEEIAKPEPKQLTTIEPTQNNHTEENNIPVKTDQNVNKVFNDNVNTHSVLMDEIRNVGGLKKARLRSVEDRKINDINEKVPTGGGLMADLHKKLAMRRQGISGNNNQNDSSLGGVMSRAAFAMLPPNLESESEVDGDDDTEGDWDD